MTAETNPETETRCCGSWKTYFKVYTTALRYVFNAEMIFWAIISTVGVYLSCDRRNDIHKLVTITWILSYIFCCLVAGITIANKEIISNLEQLKELGATHQLIPEQSDDE